MRSVRPCHGFDFRTPLPLLFEDAVRARVSGEFSRAVEEFARTPEMGWATVGTLWGPVCQWGADDSCCVPCVCPTGADCLSPHCGCLANALDASPANAFGTLPEAPRVEARGAATAFLRLMVLFVRLIEGVYGSSVEDVPSSKNEVWVSEAETKEAALSPLPPTLEH
ncbi:hypothetical protein DFH94DRAFT_285249 [Russula ochroleuca]|jgi:hypothetical protein|uniref:Uncharacterized protein n=1 Tax=Russula ochroleuca TaxID=152965 RepID=A0A9P5MP91_9AGAM|nr:hypothetical protein DFH94DRAFT_285249 [Russula ochroleuca]